MLLPEAEIDLLTPMNTLASKIVSKEILISILNYLK